MVYNKTKRGLEKAAGIIGVVASSLGILTFLIYMFYLLTIPVYVYDYYGYDYSITYSLAGLILILPIALCVVNLILAAKCIKSPVQPDGTVKQRNGARICFAIFSFLDGQWVTFGLMIAVLCMKDLVEQKPYGQRVGETVGGFAGNVVGSTKSAYDKQVKQQTNQAVQSFDDKIAELKHLKELGVLDDETYKKAVNKLLKDIL